MQIIYKINFLISCIDLLIIINLYHFFIFYFFYTILYINFIWNNLWRFTIIYSRQTSTYSSLFWNHFFLDLERFFLVKLVILNHLQLNNTKVYRGESTEKFQPPEILIKCIGHSIINYLFIILSTFLYKRAFFTFLARMCTK